MTSGFENKLIKDIHATRYIASWIVAGGNLSRKPKGKFDFRVWLESLGLSEEEVYYIYCLAENGKLELQGSAKAFMKALND